MTTNTKIKSPRAQLVHDLAQFEIVLAEVNRESRDLNLAQTMLPMMLVTSALVLVVRALLVSSEEVSDAVSALPPYL